VEGIKEVQWLRKFLIELGFEIPHPTTMQQDNQSAIAIAVNPVHHARVKHMEIKTHFIRENIENGNVHFVYCPTELMIADLLTKPLPGPQFRTLVEKLGMVRLKDIHFGNEIKGTQMNVKLN
jgi:sugar phosphate isomerase/epimerase